MVLCTMTPLEGVLVVSLVMAGLTAATLWVNHKLHANDPPDDDDDVPPVEVEPQSPMAAVADALREKARQERAAFDARAKPQLAHTCANCVHFDVEEGQAALSQNPAFVKATQYISPAKMFNRPEKPANVPMKAKWRDFGACMLDEQVRYNGDGCDRFEPRGDA